MDHHTSCSNCNYTNKMESGAEFFSNFFTDRSQTDSLGHKIPLISHAENSDNSLIGHADYVNINFNVFYP